MTMHVCRFGPGGKWWQPTTGFMTMHAVTCRLTAWSLGSAPAPYAQLRVWETFTFTFFSIMRKEHMKFGTVLPKLLSMMWMCVVGSPCLQRWPTASDILEKLVQSLSLATCYFQDVPRAWRGRHVGAANLTAQVSW